MTIRKIEYRNEDDAIEAFAYEISGVASGQEPEVKVEYLEDIEYLENPDNGYVDQNGHPTTLLSEKIKDVERINSSTWEYMITNVSRLDKRNLRGGKNELIQTYFDKWASQDDLITGIGDLDDCMILKIDQESNPEVMSKDLFISTFSGFTTGFSSGVSNELQYSQILNPVNTDNVNNFYPVLNHGYFYTGQEEFYCYGNKQTEVLNPDKIAKDEFGNGYATISGQPNPESPLYCMMIQDDYRNIIAESALGGFENANNNSYRERYDSIPASPSQIFEHNLITEEPFVYLVDDDGSIGLPTVDILSRDEIRIDTPEETFNGYMNVLRPNTNFRLFDIDVTTSSININHGLETTTPFVFIKNGSEIALIQYSVLDNQNIFIPQLGISGRIIVLNVEDYSSVVPLTNFASGIVNHGLGLTTIDSSAYVDPWVYGVKPVTVTEDEIVIVDSTIIDEDNIYVNFGSLQTEVDLVVIDFWRLNFDLGEEDESFILNTDLFAFKESEFYGNEGVASPFLRVYPEFSGLANDVQVDEFLLRAQYDKYVPQPLDFISGYVENADVLPNRPTYITSTNQLFLPDTVSGTPVLLYEKVRADAFEFRFRGTDVSPVTWYNTDRVVAIQSEDHDLYNIKLFPEVNSINLNNAGTRGILGITGGLDYQYLPFDLVAGEPTNRSVVTVFASDDVDVALKDQILEVSTRRALYTKDNEGVKTRLFDYSIDILDNTKEMFSIASGLVADLPSGQTVLSPSLFDSITFVNSPGSVDIYDDDGYLFTTKPGLKSYRVPFIGSLYDRGADTLTHNTYVKSNVFGTSVVELGFHNTERASRIRTMRVAAYPSGLTEGTTDIKDVIEIDIHPITVDDTVGYTDDNDNPNPFVEVKQVKNGFNYMIIEDHINTIDTAEIFDEMYLQEASGIIPGDTYGGVPNIFDLGDKYIVEIDDSYVSPYVASGVVSGYIPYSSGITIAFDTSEEPASILDRGEYYG